MATLKRSSSGRLSLRIIVAAVLIVLMLTASVPSLKAVSEAPQVQWSKTFGAYRGWSVVQTSDGGYAISGENATYSVESRGYGDFAPLLAKIDLSGDLQWGKTYGHEFGVSGNAFSVIQTKDLGYALCGEGWLLKTDAQGNVQWNNTFGWFQRSKVIQASDGGYVLAGTKINFDTGQYFPTILKTDENGNLLLNKTFIADSSIARANDIVETNDRGYAVVGDWNSKSWFAKTDSNLNLLLNQTYEDGAFGSVAKADDGNYVLSGGSGFGGIGWLIKVDSLGDMLWNQTFSNDDGDYWLSSVAQTSDGGYIAAGSIFTNANDYALLVRTDSSGKVLWNATYGGKDSNSAYSIITTYDGGYALAGSQDNNVWLVKFAPETAVPESPNSMVWIITATIVILAVIITALLAYLAKFKKIDKKTK